MTGGRARRLDRVREAQVREARIREARLGEALTRGADHHRAGRWAEAARAYAEALAEQPDNVDALALLGGTALRLGRPAEALALLERAVASDPEHALARLNQGRALLELDRAADAERAFSAALLTRPGFPEALIGRARALMDTGRFDEAEASLQLVLASRPADARLLADLGACRLARGDSEGAAGAWRAAAALTPDLPGLAERRSGVARNLGSARLAEGSPEALDWLREAVMLVPGGVDRAALLGLADALFQHPDPPADLTPELCVLLDTDGIDHQRIERAIRCVLREVPGVSAFLDGSGEIGAVAGALAAHPLFVRWLNRTIVATPAWTRLVDQLRLFWYEQVAAEREVSLELLTALATQAWWTEWASVEDGLVAAPMGIVGAGKTDDAVSLATFAMFRPLSEWPGEMTHQEPLATLIRAQLVEPLEEAALASTLPSLGDATDLTSRAVREQYEQNPYPRLVGLHLRPAGSFVAMARALLGDPAYQGPRRVLVAGGGTGQHPIGVAAGLSGAGAGVGVGAEAGSGAGAEVFCVDLSRASLGRAARLAAVHGVTNLRFVQGDLLSLGHDDGLGQFDFVDCVGVLHHLADPLAGGRVLVSKLAPGGILRLGLYSERGRSEIVAARALAAERGWVPTPEGLRLARRELLALDPRHAAAPVTASIDFYSQSGLRDLVFHPCEHRYTPTQVGSLIEALGLTVVALQHARPEANRLYRERWPTDSGLDLRKWDELEVDHPRIFSGMIHVWSRV